MADNSIPRNYDQIVQMLENAADGAKTHGVAIGLKQNDEAALRAALTALVGKPAGPGGVPPAEPGLKDKWNLAKAGKTSATRDFSLVKQTARGVARACINVLKPRLGDQWNNQWQTAGFTDSSIAVPDNPLALLQQLRSYFAAHPTHEVSEVNATATQCEASAQLVSDAASASNQSNTDAGNAKKNLEIGVAEARSRLIGLREELTQLLDDDDERWYAFGFSKPSDIDTPEVPENLVVTPGAPGSHLVFIDWDDSLRSTSYRVTVTKATPPTTRLKNLIVTDSEAALNDLPSGIPIAVTVSGRNSKGGESAETSPVTTTVP
jgi:hypothetical protein